MLQTYVCRVHACACVFLCAYACVSVRVRVFSKAVYESCGYTLGQCETTLCSVLIVSENISCFYLYLLGTGCVIQISNYKFEFKAYLLMMAAGDHISSFLKQKKVYFG